MRRMRRLRWVSVAMGLGLLVAGAAPAAASGQPPTANFDFYSVNLGSGPLVVPAPGVLANDTDPEGDALTAQSPGFGEPVHGTVVRGTDGSFTYTPRPGFVGTDSFAYQAFDGTSPSFWSWAFITVNAAPTAVPDHLTVLNNHWITGVAAPAVLANDTDPNGDELTVQLLKGPVIGLGYLYPNGGFLYVPKPGYVGYDAFTYRTFDGSLWSEPTIVFVKVKASNAPPSPAADTYTSDEDTLLLGDVLANDTDPDGDPVTAEVVGFPSSGELTLQTDGTFEYYPEWNFDSDVTFTYRISDGLVWSAPVEVLIDIRAVNDPPEAYEDFYETFGLAPASGNVLENDFDPVEFDGLSAQGPLSGPQFGTLEFNANGSFVYTPDEEAVAAGFDSFTYQACDSTCGGIASVTINIYAE